MRLWTRCADLRPMSNAFSSWHDGSGCFTAKKEVRRLEECVVRRSRVCRTFCFALQRNLLSFARPYESRQRKGRPGYASARSAPNHCQFIKQVFGPTGCGQNSDRLRDPQTCGPHRRRAPDTLRPCASRSLHTGPSTSGLARSVELLQLQTASSLVAAFVSAYASLSRPTKDGILSER